MGQVPNKTDGKSSFLQFLLAPTLRSCAGLSTALIWAERVWKVENQRGAKSEARSLTEHTLIEGG